MRRTLGSAVSVTRLGRREGLQGDSRPEPVPSRRRPICRADPVRAQQGQGDAVEAEPEAARVGHLTAGGDDPERLPEMVEVAVRRGDRRRMLSRIDRRHNLVLERLRPLVLGQDAADPPEEGVVRHHRLNRQAERVEDLRTELQPAVAMLPGCSASPT
jgi:hypothetical protein